MYLEAYTSILGVPRARLEEAWSIKIEEAPRELVESEIEPILERARHEDIAMLVVGDPFGATTHCDLLARARELGVTTHVVHNASIMNAIGCCGLQLYRFGETISIPFFSQTWRPDSFYAKVAANRRAGLHTLALLDIKVREPTMISLAKGKKPEYLPPRYMSIRQAIGQLLAVEAERAEGVCPPEARAIGVSRVGHADQQVVTGTLEELRAVDFGGPLHSLVLIGTLGLDEAELLGAFAMAAAVAARLDGAAAAAEDEAAARAAAAHAGERFQVDDATDDDDDHHNEDEPIVSAASMPSALPTAPYEPAFDLKALKEQEAAEMKKKIEENALKAKQKEKEEDERIAKMQALEAQGVKVAGGMHKFDASEVDVNGGTATADDFLDAFGFD